jgi:hypothetical protein
MNTTLQAEANTSMGGNGREERDHEINNGKHALYKKKPI